MEVVFAKDHYVALENVSCDAWKKPFRMYANLKEKLVFIENYHFSGGERFPLLICFFNFYLYFLSSSSENLQNKM